MRKMIFALFFLALVVTVFAHEYILLATKYRLQPGDNLEVHLFVADGFNIQLERPYQKRITQKFELVTTDSIIDLSQQNDGTFPVINKKVNFTGGGLIHAARDYARITLANEKFLDYLKEDHIDGIADKLDRSKKEQKERYTRYIKCLVQSGDQFTDTLYKKITGHNFEIVFLKNPYTLKVGDELPARILFMGKPLSKKVITARSRSGNEAASVQTSITDANGICRFKLNKKGEWFVHATHMIPCPDKQDSDWESFWATYSFGVE